MGGAPSQAEAESSNAEGAPDFLVLSSQASSSSPTASGPFVSNHPLD